jgi:hypothetical protein
MVRKLGVFKEDYIGEEGTCVFHNSSRPIYNCVNCKEDGTCRVYPPVELIAKNG